MKVLIPESHEDVQGLIEANQPVPELSTFEIRIKTKAIGINRADLLQKEGKYPPPPGASDILGLEVSGTIDAVGDLVDQWKVGDEVFALLAGGGYAEFVVVHQDLVMRKPAAIDLIDCAAIAEVFLTAYQALFLLGDIQENERALIHAGASGVGTAAIQMCKQLGIDSYTTAGSEEKREFCLSLGASYAINYNNQSFDDVIRQNRHEIDVIMDPIGKSYFNRNLDSIASDGRWIVLAFMSGAVAEINLAKVLMKRVKLMGSTLRARSVEYKSKLIHAFLSRFGDKLETGEMKPIIDHIFDWSDINDAHAYMEKNLNKGKILVKGPA